MKGSNADEIVTQRNLALTIRTRWLSANFFG